MSAIPSILFIISSDPRISKKTAEAVRIAAGVGAWKKAAVTIYLRDAAVQVLGEFADELEDGDNFPRYLPLIVENGNHIYAQKNASALPPVKKATVKYQAITDTELARLCAQSTYTARF